MAEWGKVFSKTHMHCQSGGRIFRRRGRIMASDTRTMSPEGPSAVSQPAAIGSDKGLGERPPGRAPGFREALATSCHPSTHSITALICAIGTADFE